MLLSEPEDFGDNGMGRAWVFRRPFGVVGIITPWNRPFTLAVTGMVPALLAGNTVVLAVAPTAPLAAMGALQVVAEHLPPGVLSVVTGPGDVVAQRLVDHPDITKISFTGSVGTGKLVTRRSAQSEEPHPRAGWQRRGHRARRHAPRRRPLWSIGGRNVHERRPGVYGHQEALCS